MSKPKNWRKYYGYRPPPLTHVASEADLRRQRDAYLDWLAQSGRIQLDAGEIAAERQRLAADVEWASATLSRAREAFAGSRRSIPRRRDLDAAEERQDAFEHDQRDLLRGKAEAYAMSFPHAKEALLSTEHESDADVMREEWLSDRCRIRTVVCRSATGRNLWAMQPYPRGVPLLAPGSEDANIRLRWVKFPKPDAPTVYSILVDGRYVDAFLSMARARRFCRERGYDRQSFAEPILRGA